jgi:hypothetical protein
VAAVDPEQSSRLSRRSPVASSPESVTQRSACRSAAGPQEAVPTCVNVQGESPAFSTLTCAVSLPGFIALKLQLEIVGFDASIRDNQLVLKAFLRVGRIDRGGFCWGQKLQDTF